MSKTRIGTSAALAVLALLLAAAWTAADEEATFKKVGKVDEAFAKKVGTAVIKAAHGTGKKIGLVEYKATNPKPDRTNLNIKMEYYGAIRKGTRYVANIVVQCDTSDKDSWRVLNIEYKDNNKIPYSKKKLQALINNYNKR
jgi:hypothetical protein